MDVEISLPSNTARSKNCSGNSISATNPVGVFTRVHAQTHTQILPLRLLNEHVYDIIQFIFRDATPKLFIGSFTFIVKISQHCGRLQGHCST